MLEPLQPRTGGRAAAWYLLITLGMTYPLVLGLSRDIPWDLGDSLLNCWILGWNSERFFDGVRGDWNGLRRLFDANIFYPQPLTLAYSELLLTQTLQALPVYGVTGNLILAYNVVFLATFVLSGLGAYLLVRELSGDWRAGFAAGLVFAFLPWRFGQMPHMQVLSAQWMPFTLYALRRYFVTERPLALVGAAAALVANNLSNGYFLLFFAPVVPAYVLWEMTTRGLLGRWRVWLSVAATGAASVALTVPWLLPYVWLRRATGERRSVDEVKLYSADVYAYVTAESNLSLLGPYMRWFPRPEGDLFPGFTPLALGLLAIGWGLWRAYRATASAGPVLPPGVGLWHRARAAIVCLAVLDGLVYAVVLALVFAGLGGKYTVGPLDIQVNSVTTALRHLAGSAVVLLVLSPRVRAIASAGWRSPLFCYAALIVFAWYMSLGPRPQSFGRPLNTPALYPLFLEHVPGYDGLRVPARFAVLVMLGLGVLAGYGVRDLLAPARRWSAVLVAGLGVFFLAESTAVPIPVNVTTGDRFNPPPARVTAARNAPAVYRHLARELPRDAVLVELPFGDASWELRYVYYSTVHWRPLVNGYSGGFPEGYLRLRGFLDDPRRAPEGAFEALMASGATHLVLHTSAYRDSEADEVRRWLESRGLRPSIELGSDLVYPLQ